MLALKKRGETIKEVFSIQIMASGYGEQFVNSIQNILAFTNTYLVILIIVDTYELID